MSRAWGSEASVKISIDMARQIVLRSQGLDGSWTLPPGKEGVAQVIGRLGHVQIDTISIVARAHQHILWSRLPGYMPQMLHELQASDRRAFEYWWEYAAAYIPMSDYRYYRPRMRAFAESPRARSYICRNAELVKAVLERIRKEGPLGSADFEAPEGFKRGTWWSWKPAKEALETLFSMGELMVAERRSFQRLYDLAERVLPPGTDTTDPDPKQALQFATRRMLLAHGVASTQDMGRTKKGRDAAIEALKELAATGEAIPLEVEGLDGETCYALRETLEEAAEQAAQATGVHILSPFDNLVINRRRLQRLFGFDYSLECYLPAARRRYGYFCLPILWGTRFVGRLDPKADRERKTLIVRRLIFEPEFADYDALMPGLVDALRAFAALNGCDRVVVEGVSPEGACQPCLEGEL